MNREIIPKEFKEAFMRKSQKDNLNINLTKNIDKRVLNLTNQYTNNTNNSHIINNTNTNNKFNEKQGFFNFILNVILLPITLTKLSIKYIWKKYDIKNLLYLDKLETKKRKFVRKFMTEKNVYDFEEIY